MTAQILNAPPAGSCWHILDVMRRGSWPLRRGRPRNDWVALLIDIDPELLGDGGRGRPVASSCWLDLGRHKGRDAAWEHAEAMVATRH